MLELLTCARSHFWESIADDGYRRKPCCPECGLPAETLLDLELESTTTLSSSTSQAEPPAISDDGSPNIAGYELLEYLGKESSGVRRYRCRHQLTSREVLLKVVFAKEDATQRAWNSLRGEAVTLGKLSHTHILQIYDTGERNRQLFYNSVEFISGPNLAQKTADKYLATDRIAELMEMLSRAVEYSHRKHVLHRHLEPSSILLQPVLSPDDNSPARSHPGDGILPLHSSCYRPVLVGFGLARRAADGDLADAYLFEDPGFMSPEQAWTRSRDLGPHTDIYGLGAILYFLLTGRPPFRGPTLGDVIDAIQTAKLVKPSDIRNVSSDLEAICIKCLSRQSKKRYKTAEELADDFRRVRLHQAPRCHRGTVLRRSYLWFCRHPAIATGIVWGVLSISVLLFVLSNENAKIAHVLNNSRTLQHQLQWTQTHNQHLENRLNELLTQQQFLTYRNRIERADLELNRGHLEHTQQLLDGCLPELRFFEWHHLWRQSKKEPSLTLPRCSSTVNILAFHPRNSRWLMIATYNTRDRTAIAQFWDIVDKRLLSSIGPLEGKITHIVFSLETDIIAVIHSGHKSVLNLYQWWGDDRNLQFVQRVDNLPDSISTVSFCRSGKQLIMMGASGQGGQLDLPTGLFQRFSLELRIFSDPRHTVHMAQSYDGERLALGSTQSTKLWLVGMDNNRSIQTFNGVLTTRTMAFSPDGNLAVARMDRSVYLHGGQQLSEIAFLRRFPRNIEKVAFFANGKRLAVLDEAKMLYILGKGPANWETLLELPVPTLQAYAFSSNGKAMAILLDKQVDILGEITGK